jgi:hypothetical protein
MALASWLPVVMIDCSGAGSCHCHGASNLSLWLDSVQFAVCALFNFYPADWLHPLRGQSSTAIAYYLPLVLSYKPTVYLYITASFCRSTLLRLPSHFIPSTKPLNKRYSAQCLNAPSADCPPMHLIFLPQSRFQLGPPCESISCEAMH